MAGRNPLPEDQQKVPMTVYPDRVFHAELVTLAGEEQGSSAPKMMLTLAKEGLAARKAARDE